MSALDSLTSTVPVDEALRAPVRAFLTGAMKIVPHHIRARSGWRGGSEWAM